MSFSVPYKDKLNEFFYDGLNRQTSLCLYGSAATGNWVANRSDLDLVILIPRDQQELLGSRIRSWHSTPALPILDGYALTSSRQSFEAIRLDRFLKVSFPSTTSIDLIDQWSIRNRSKHLFGNDAIDKIFPAITLKDLKEWAIEDLRCKFSTRSSVDTLPETKDLSGLIWSISWAARMLMLSRGAVCGSKQKALQWLGSEYPKIGDLVDLLLNDYHNSDNIILSISTEQSLELRMFCFELIQQEINSKIECS